MREDEMNRAFNPPPEEPRTLEEAFIEPLSWKDQLVLGGATVTALTTSLSFHTTGHSHEAAVLAGVTLGIAGAEVFVATVVNPIRRLVNRRMGSKL
jgi:hypothetical protein